MNPAIETPRPAQQGSATEVQAPALHLTVSDDGRLTTLSDGVLDVQNTGELRRARAAAWARIQEAVEALPAGATIIVDDAVTGQHRMLITAGATTSTVPAALDDAGLGILEGDPALPEGASPLIAHPRRRLGRRGWVLAGAGGLCLGATTLALVLGTSTTPPVAPNVDPTSPSAASSSPLATLWTLPEGVQPAGGAGTVLAGIDAHGDLALFDGVSGTPITTKDKIPADSPLRVTGLGDLTVIQSSPRSGVAVDQGVAIVFEDLGTLQSRGPAPALVDAKTKDAPLYYLFRDGKATKTAPPVKGAALFGALSDGGAVWALSGGKIAIQDTDSKHRIVTLKAPKGAGELTEWVSVTNARALTVWEDGQRRLLTIHDLATGDVVSTTELAADENGTPSAGGVLLVTGKDGAPSRWANRADLDAPTPGLLQAITCGNDAAVAAARVWCPEADGSWTSEDFTVPGKPLAAGKGFVVATVEDVPVILPGLDHGTPE